MPGMINMDQNDDKGVVVLEDPFLGADIDAELENDEAADFGNDVEATTTDEDETNATPASKDADEDTSADDDGGDSDGDADKGDEVTPEPAADDGTDTEGDEEGDGDDDDSPPADKDKDQRIPKSRFDEVNEKRKAAEQRLKEIDDQNAAAAAAEENAFDFDKAELEYMGLVVDGKFPEAQAVRKTIRAAEAAENQRVARQEAAVAREGAKGDLVFQDAIDDLEVEYPQFVQGHEDYDSSLVDEVLSLHQSFLDQDLDPVAAIKKATKYVAKMNDFTPSSAAPEPAPKEEGKPALTEKPVNKKDARRTAKAKTTQPQQLPKTDGEREAPIDMVSMTEEEFDALPESKKRELRGDFG